MTMSTKINPTFAIVTPFETTRDYGDSLKNFTAIVDSVNTALGTIDVCIGGDFTLYATWTYVDASLAAKTDFTYSKKQDVSIGLRAIKTSVDTSLNAIYIKLGSVDTSLNALDTVNVAFGVRFGKSDASLNTLKTKDTNVDTSLNAIWIQINNIDLSIGRAAF